ncbi:hypothetical protein QL919_11290 [Psychrobacter sp. APC 3426]|uniref:hypothetical protein n=1 Tax=Psychrobacter sp. APC 3426 TaxID=3035177 RepID=UPI0025B356B8|nr:hypothetical protein [Psychrobacter sp. APC 3426]MDN3399308.1 hypothetical protein [Psychrobacter sp. APC 3426]
MNDSNNDSSIDLDKKLESTLAKIADAKNRQEKQNGDIYKRFLKRVESTTDSIEPNRKLEPLLGFNKPSAYEPLTAEELSLFSNTDEAATESDKTTSASSNETEYLDDEDKGLDFPFDFSNREEVGDQDNNNEPDTHDNIDKVLVSDDNVYLAEDESLIHAEDNQTSSIFNQVSVPTSHEPEPVSTPASKRKPFLITMAFGSLLLAGIVLGYSTISNLSQSTDNIAFENVTTDNISKGVKSIVGDKVAPMSSASASNEAVEPAEEPTTTTTANVSTSSIDNSAINEQPSTQEPVKTTTAIAPAQQSDKPMNADSNAEPVITYEDFRDESQTTLYRETD